MHGAQSHERVWKRRIKDNDIRPNRPKGTCHSCQPKPLLSDIQRCLSPTGDACPCRRFIRRDPEGAAVRPDVEIRRGNIGTAVRRKAEAASAIREEDWTHQAEVAVVGTKLS